MQHTPPSHVGVSPGLLATDARLYGCVSSHEQELQDLFYGPDGGGCPATHVWTSSETQL